ncbi:helix-turn-helix domain-containing protein [Hydrogenophaga sp. SL48]|uniref:helix-turn-helix domain-containing protein n=1 Tax=Hydrogenophaga sp. SL48 TaxID=2806347 RepID=UPI001F3BA784|nr:helix-turn-helix domain-containing protein [Hydrogenophaga sp. SL48]UJW81190.1 helix-turn-helix domain-containing protein [Hydrogenophaga sp. SL48]
MLQSDIQSRVLNAARMSRLQGITQAQIAEALGASQSQVSRILSGRGLRKSRLLEEVCLFVERGGDGISSEAVHENEELIEAVRQAWDGSASHARALAAVIRSLAVLQSSGAGHASTSRGSA